MQAIGFNEHYGLQTAVIERRKTKTRRTELLNLLDGFTEDDFWFGLVDGKMQVQLYDDHPGPTIIKPRYKIGEVVAIRQSYSEVYDELFGDVAHINNDRALELHMSYILMEAQKDTIKGWTNKMFIRPSLMPHHIRITDINVERLQDIGKEDCLKEGIDEDHTEYGDALYWVSVPHKGISWEEYKKRSYELARHEFNGKTGSYFWDTPQGAFAALIDKVSGKGTWGRNPWVFAYSFELID